MYILRRRMGLYSIENIGIGVEINKSCFCQNELEHKGISECNCVMRLFYK